MIKTYPPSQPYEEASFRALTDALLPASHYGMSVHEYIVYALNHYVTIQQQLFQLTVPLAYPTAQMLDSAAAQLAYTNQVQASSHQSFPGGGMFSRLSREDRVKTLSALERLEVDLYLLPAPFQNNAGLVKFVTDALNRFSHFGFYSEWPAYGSTRLNPPEYRHLEYFPAGWQQAGYPGVSLGYREFRGFLLKMRREEDDA